MTLVTQLQTDQRELGTTRLTTLEQPALQAGEARLKIGRLALTANNITYAAFGDTPHLRYWDFYPTGSQGWGHMPAWGFAEVVETTVEGLAIGERFYGFWPIASEVVMQPVRITERGFYDGSAHRLELTSAYNQYQRISTDAAYRAENENYQMLLRPLFITSFMLADFLEDNQFFGARRVIISSASSKTAYGTAFCLEQLPGLELIGLTSARNCAFVDSLGCYSRSVSYDELESLSADVPTLYVDFSGNDDLRARIHSHFDEALKYNCYAGSAHSQDHLSASAIPPTGPKPEPYFAPYQIRKRNADWGPAEVTRRFNEAQLAFIRRVSDSAKPWMNVTEHQGLEAGQQLIRNLVDGRVDANCGHVLVLE